MDSHRHIERKRVHARGGLIRVEWMRIQKEPVLLMTNR